MKRSQFFQGLRARNSPTRVTLRQYGSLLSTYLGPQYLRVGAMALFLLANIGLQLLGPQFIRTFIDTFQHSGNEQALTMTALFYLGVAIGSRLVSALAIYFCEDVGWTATNRLRADLTLHCLNLDRSFHTAHTPGELLERVDGNIDTLAGFFSQFIIQVLGNTILMIGVLILMVREHILFGIVLSAYLVISISICIFVQKQATARYKFHWQAQAELSGFWGELLGALEDIASSSAAPYIIRRYFHLQRQENSTEIRSIVFWAGFECTELVLEVLSMVLVLILSAYLFVQGAITLGTVILLLSYNTQLLDHTMEIADQFGSLQQATASLERINEIYHTSSRVQDGPGVSFPTGALDIAFERVSFHYEAEQSVLQNINFRVSAGEKVGLIGRSGSGKTTLIRLLMRFYDPVCGTVTLGEQDIRQAQLNDLRRRIGLVTQEVELFHATLRDNLTFFDTSIEDQRILQAISQLGIDEWYARLPEGLETMLTNTGAGLSAGEAQLLACIRVFLKDPQLIILDEATSRLDPATEKLITQTTERLLTGRTALIIAHRLSTVERVDQIMVLEEGRILEYGERAALACSATSRYAQMLQMAHPEKMFA
ncbi:MAG TPA: ABC transporter ATP-binding protein [Ktedonosporobacter sp.]|nr:ABC transporter ATP-binding protein [Ktedonosporobacter sp.]